MTTLPPIQRFTTRSGIRIYRIPVEAFPNFLIVYCYVLLEAGEPMLIDTGSGLGVSTDQLLAGIASVRDDFGEPLALTGHPAHLDHTRAHRSFWRRGDFTGIDWRTGRHPCTGSPYPHQQ